MDDWVWNEEPSRTNYPGYYDFWEWYTPLKGPNMESCSVLFGADRDVWTHVSLVHAPVNWFPVTSTTR